MLTYANQLTILRIVAAPVLVALLALGYPRTATLLFLLAGVTDGLDGLLARRLHQKTPLGSILDPAADKVLVTAAFVTLSVPSIPVALHIPIWLTATSILRDILIALFALSLYLREGQSHFPPSILGKATTAAQLLTIALALAANFVGAVVAIFPPVVYSTLMLIVASGLHYLVRTAKRTRPS